ncbi:hypothetical protein [Bradyrhizobium sp. Tv2a-2]|uniref:hypothetical protein n=1 Tax=Bradyrhizobium sp. Tv2a-2 TaxID=113395 RepID=UPI000425B727|nr:hypothetical protein [Bradyrhizobium sp. Tv2a-2]
MRRHSQSSSPLPGLAPWLIDLAVRLAARALHMPAPLLHAIAAFVYASVQEADRRLIALCRPSR